MAPTAYPETSAASRRLAGSLAGSRATRTSLSTSLKTSTRTTRSGVASLASRERDGAAICRTGRALISRSSSRAHGRARARADSSPRFSLFFLHRMALTLSLSCETIESVIHGRNNERFMNRHFANPFTMNFHVSRTN